MPSIWCAVVVQYDRFFSHNQKESFMMNSNISLARRLVNLAKSLTSAAESDSLLSRWEALLKDFPEGLRDEVRDERPSPNEEDYEWLSSYELVSQEPVRVLVKDLLTHPENRRTIARTNPEICEKINNAYGTNIRFNTSYESDPSRYERYASQSGETAQPSVMFDGEILWGCGRFVAALLRGDPYLRVWKFKSK